MYKSYRSTAKGVSTGSVRKPSRIIRRSTLVNFFAILLIFGAVLALHKASKEFAFFGSTEEERTPATGALATETIETESPAVQPIAATVSAEVPSLPAIAMAEPLTAETDIEVEAKPAVADAEVEAESEPAQTTAPEEEPKVQAATRPARRTTRHTGRLMRARRNDYAADRAYGIELLDNQSARRSYREQNRAAARSTRDYEKGVSTQAVYTMPEEPAAPSHPIYAYDDLDSEAARQHYNAENKMLSR